MEFFKQWAISICACGIIGTIFSMIAPKGSMEKILNLVIAVFIFTSILTPFLKMDKIDFDFSGSSASNEETLQDMVEKSNEISLTSAELSVQKVVSDFLNSNDFPDAKVAVEMENDDEKNVSIKKIEILLPEEKLSQTNKVKLLVESEFKANVEVNASEDLINE